MARNSRLHQQVCAWEDELENAFAQSGTKQRAINEFRYGVRSWKIELRLLTRLEFGPKGPNPRFVVTNLDLPANTFYDTVYCQRGEAQNRIKEVQLDLFGDRASCHAFHVNWLRLLLAALAYALM